MKLSRRGAMGAGLGAVVAAPRLVQQAQQQVDKAPFPSFYKTAGDNAAEGALKQLQEAEYTENRKKHLYKILNGEFDEWQQNELDSLDIDYQWFYDIDDLKSVSNTHKIQMKRKLIKERKKKEWIEQAKRGLASLLKGGTG